MGIYVDADDIRQHFRQGGGLNAETIEEIMEEQEEYVRVALDIETLPPDNNILKMIIRNLTIAEAIYQMTPATADNLIKADTQRREALRKLREINETGLGTSPRGAPEDDIHNPLGNDPIFPYSDFGIYPS